MEDFDKQVNPLKQFFRQPGLLITLPSGGRFQDPNNVRFGVSGELEIYPMRAADEMLMKSPESLMSGVAIEKAIASCAPGITNVQQLPSPDVDAILLAIRAATYGEVMEIHEGCPECEHVNHFETNIVHMLETQTAMLEEYPVRLTDDVIVYLKPFTFKTSTRANIVTFQEARKVQLIDNDNFSDEEKQAQLNKSYEVITAMNMTMIADSIDRVVIPEGSVTDRLMIAEFVANIEAAWVNKLQDTLTDISNKTGVNKEKEVICEKCNHEWKTTVGFDPAAFFGPSS